MAVLMSWDVRMEHSAACAAARNIVGNRATVGNRKASQLGKRILATDASGVDGFIGVECKRSTVHCL
jgi:hypothetical protein